MEAGQYEAVSSSHGRTYTQDYDEQEIHVSNVVELEPQVLGDEADGRVLGRPDFISLVVL